MASIMSRQDLAEYCLRALGGGVIEIEVSADQLDDRVEEAIEYYTEYHYDGIERDYVVRKISATSFTVVDASKFSVNEVINISSKSIKTSITAIDLLTNRITVGICEKAYGITLNVSDVITGQNSNSDIIQSVIMGDADNGYIVVPDTIVGVNRVLNLTSVLSSGDYMFNAQYQIMMSEIQNLTSSGSSYLYSALSYLSHLDYILRKERNFRFNRRENRIRLDISWKSDVKINDIVVVEVYRALDDSVFPKMLNDRWLKEYTTALIKKQWGANLKKYTGMQLPGGLQYDGQTIFNEAQKEIEELKDEALTSSAPLEFFVG